MGAFRKSKQAVRQAVPCWLRTLFPGRVLDAKHCETTTNARNHPIPKTPVTMKNWPFPLVAGSSVTSLTRKRSAVRARQRPPKSRAVARPSLPSTFGRQGPGHAQDAICSSSLSAAARRHPRRGAHKHRARCGLNYVRNCRLSLLSATPERSAVRPGNASASVSQCRLPEPACSGLAC